MSPVNMKKLLKLAKELLGKNINNRKIKFRLMTSFFHREVFKARERINSAKKFVAMKKVLMDNEKEGVSQKKNATFTNK